MGGRGKPSLQQSRPRQPPVGRMWSMQLEDMTALARRGKAISLALVVRAHPERDERPARGVAALVRLELDHPAVLCALLHPDRKVREPLEHGVLLLDHDLDLRCMCAHVSASGERG